MTVDKMVEDKAEQVRAQPTAHAAKAKKGVPPLKHGDRLTRKEFHRRYEGMPYIKKAQLIEGVVYMPTPVRMDIHSRPHACIMAWLSAYWVATPGVDLGDNATVFLDSHNEPQPDVLLRIEPTQGGSSQISEGYVDGAPELVVEVAGTSAAHDLHEKLEAYQRNGVQEYIVWQTQARRLDWFRLVDGKYVPLTPDADGVIHSEVSPGLCLAVDALLAGNLALVLSELRKGLSTAEHQAFVERLSEASNQHRDM